jgi:hypothetical protein
MTRSARDYEATTNAAETRAMKTRTAYDAYLAHHAAALALVERIHEAIENHDDAPADDLHWGHVTEIVDIERGLQEIADRLFGEGEYAPENR